MERRKVRLRTQKLSQAISEVWPVPAGHRVKHPESLRKILRVDLADLVAGGTLVPGMQLVPRIKEHSKTTAALLPDGRVDVDGIAYATPTDAATRIRGRRTSGWWFFFVDPVARRSLRDVRNEYVQSLSLDADYDEADEEGDEDED